MLVPMTIDVMLPFWGDPALLRQTVASVQAQTDPDWRLTVIDDGYPDESVPAYFAALDDPRISYRRNPENAGIVANFRASVDAAFAPHLTVLGSDDLLLPEYIANVRATIARHPDVDIVQPGVRVIDEHGAPSLPLADAVKQGLLAPRTGRGDAVLSGRTLATSLIRGNWLYWPSLVFRTDSISQHMFREDLPIILDLAILMDIAFAGGSLVATHETVFEYRRHRASASQTSLLDGVRFDDERRFYRETAQRAASLGWNDTARAARWRLFSRLHATTELPGILRKGTHRGRSAAWRHILR